MRGPCSRISTARSAADPIRAIPAITLLAAQETRLAWVDTGGGVSPVNAQHQGGWGMRVLALVTDADAVDVVSMSARGAMETWSRISRVSDRKTAAATANRPQAGWVAFG